MLTALDLDALALELKAAQDQVLQIQPITTRVPDFDLSAAYEVMHLIHRARLTEGAKPIGRKIGFTNPNMWPIFGVCEPIWAYVYDTTVVQLKGTDTTFALGMFAEPMIEPEIVLHFHKAPQAGARLVDVADCIDWVAHGFEIVQSHFPDWRFQAPDTVADSGLHGTLLIGPPQPLSKLGSDPVASLESFSLALSCDGRHIETGKGEDVLGSPLAAAAHLVSVLTKQTEFTPIQVGEIVTTGTITTAQSIHAGETWRSEVQGVALDGLTVEFDA
jgi:2-oxo-3-hexenedioate decarboxylase